MQAAVAQTTSTVRHLSAKSRLEGLSATMTIGGHPSSSRTLDAVIWSVDREGVVLGTDDDLGDVEYAWLEIELPGGDSVRPLMRIERNEGGTIWLSYRHLFPKDRARLLATLR